MLSLSVKKRSMATQFYMGIGTIGASRYVGMDQRQQLPVMRSSSFFISLSSPSPPSPSPSLSLFLSAFISSISICISRSFHSCITARCGFRGPSTPTTSRPLCCCCRCHHCRPTQKGRATLYTMSIYLQQIQWKLRSRAPTVTICTVISASLLLSLPIFLFPF